MILQSVWKQNSVCMRTCTLDVNICDADKNGAMFVCVVRTCTVLNIVVRYIVCVSRVAWEIRGEIYF